jgi:dTDP-4-amino-4,6-dideoxygalactose transaminase
MARDLLKWVNNLATERHPRRAVERTIETLVGVRHCQTICTGRAGLTVILRALRRLSARGRDEVIVPAYTCFSVPASVVRAGLTPRLVDVDPITLDYDRARLHATDFERVLAVVATNLYGLPSDVPGLTTLAHERGSFVVDDAAQALGAQVGGRFSGTLGDVGLYSFDKGKNISAIDGGAIVTDDQSIALMLDVEAANLPPTSPAEVLHALAKLAAYVAFLRPRLYWIPNAIPQLGLGRTVYSTSYEIARQPSVLASLALATLLRLEEYTAARRHNAATLLAGIDGMHGVRSVEPLPDSHPVYLRLPLLLASREARDSALVALNRAGIGATGSYPTSIADIPMLQGRLRGSERDAPGARSLAGRILTLPTHPLVTPFDVRRATAVLRATVGSNVRVNAGAIEAGNVAVR